MQLSFGSGAMFGQRTDITGTTPMMFGVLQDLQIDISGTTKELMGSGQFAVAAGRGQTKVTGKAKYAQIMGSVFSDLYLGVTPTTGFTDTAYLEAGSVPATTPFTITVANSATWSADWGVSYAATGQPLKKVTGTPAVGEYSAAAGVYTFATADAGAAVVINYDFTVAASGQSIAINQTSQGIQPVFQVKARATANTASGLSKTSITLYACIADKLSMPTKMGDWAVSEMDFTAFTNAANQVGRIDMSMAA